ncbi:MAG: helix-turn-helix transcriptional regulator [Bacillota bacterium]|nr:helix-turn-helix transcriptional regulator [Bacillota bacterium]
MKITLEIDNKAIGQRIREERKKLQLSQEGFAEIIGLSDYYIGQLERGERQMSLPVMVNIGNCLHVSLDYLIFGKIAQNIYVYDATDIYGTSGRNTDREIKFLLDKCSPKELELVKKLIKTILPYVSKS